MNQLHSLHEPDRGILFKSRPDREFAEWLIGSAARRMHRFVDEYTPTSMSEEMNAALEQYLAEIKERYPDLWQQRDSHNLLKSVPMPEGIRLHFDGISNWAFENEYNALFEQGGLDALRGLDRREINLQPYFPIPARTCRDYIPQPAFSLNWKHVPRFSSNLWTNDPKIKEAFQKWIDRDSKSPGYGFNYNSLEIAVEGETLTFRYFELVGDLPVLKSVEYPAAPNAYAGDFAIRFSADTWKDLLSEFGKTVYATFYLDPEGCWLGMESLGDGLSWSNIKLLPGTLSQHEAALRAHPEYPANRRTVIEVDKKTKTWLNKAAQKKVDRWQADQAVRTWGFTQRVLDQVAITATDGYRAHIEFGDYPDEAFVLLPKSQDFSTKPPDVHNIILSHRARTVQTFDLDVKDFTKQVKRLQKLAKDSGGFITICWEPDRDDLLLTAYSPERGESSTVLPIQSMHSENRDIPGLDISIMAKYLLDALSGMTGVVTFGYTEYTNRGGMVEMRNGSRVAVIMTMERGERP